MVIFDFIVIIAGIIAGMFLFYKFPILSSSKNKKTYKISVIIPCRNEQSNIGELLSQLTKQTYQAFEIICVNDQSEDNTKEIISSFENIKLVDIVSKPDGWNGKPYALTQGAKAASGEVLLFLDADVKLSPYALETLVSTYEKKGIISVQPYHKTKKISESLAIFFNLLAVAGTGITLPKTVQRGMFGPVFMIGKEDYEKNGAHELVKGCITEDYELGLYYEKKNIPYTLFIGNKDISFRMYPHGIKSQIQGFSKNFSSGALSAGFLTTAMSIIWLIAITSLAIKFVVSFASLNVPDIITYGILYAFTAIHLLFITKKIGKYNILLIIFYPLTLLWFHFVFVLSLIKKLIFRSVVWKGRKIKI